MLLSRRLLLSIFVSEEALAIDTLISRSPNFMPFMASAVAAWLHDSGVSYYPPNLVSKFAN